MHPENFWWMKARTVMQGVSLALHIATFVVVCVFGGRFLERIDAVKLYSEQSLEVGQAVQKQAKQSHAVLVEAREELVKAREPMLRAAANSDTIAEQARMIASHVPAWDETIGAIGNVLGHPWLRVFIGKHEQRRK